MIEIIKETTTEVSLTVDYMPDSNTLKTMINDFRNSVKVENPNFELSSVVEKLKFNQARNKELKAGFVESDVFMNEDIIKTMAVQHSISLDDEVIEWIDINNQTVTFSKDEFGALIKAGSQKVKEIYFKYRALKNELEEA